MDFIERLIPAVVTMMFLSAGRLVAQQDITYPETRTVEHVDDYHGTQVPDPYRWLEDDVRTSQEVADWVAAENKVTFAYLEAIPQREHIRQRLTQLWDYEKYGSPFKAGGRYYYSHNSGLQNQSVIFTMETLESKPRVLLDPNSWSEDGTVALAGMAFSDDGKYMAYGIQDGGSDWRTWRMMEIESGKILDDELKWIKFSECGLDEGRSRVVLQSLRRTERGRAIPEPESESEDLLSPSRNRRSRRTCWSTAARIIPIGDFKCR